MKKDGNAKTAVFSVFSLIWIVPVMIALLNSFKSNDAISRSIFSMPLGDSFVLFDNYRTALTFGNYPFLRSFGYSVLISSVQRS